MLPSPNAEITSEYQLMDIRRPGLSLRPSAIDRTLDTGLDSAGFSPNLRAFPPRPEHQALQEREREQDHVGEEIPPVLSRRRDQRL